MLRNKLKTARGVVLATAVVILATSAFGIPTVKAREEVKVNIMISPEGSGPYNAYVIMQTRAKENHPWLRPIAIETPGFTYNVTYMARTPGKWKNTVFGSGTVVEWAAAHGLKPFYKTPLKAVDDYRIIGIMGVTGGVFVTFDSAVKTPKDFVGKNVATGLLTQNEWGMHQRMLLDGWALTKKLKSLNPLGTFPNIEALIDGRADVASLVVFSPVSFKEVITPGPFKTLRAAKRDYYYVNVPRQMIEAYNKKTGAIFEIRDYAANMLPDQPKPFTTFGDRIILSAHKSFPEELAYEFVKLWIKMGPVIAKYNAMGRMWDGETIASAVKDMRDRVHPGALRAFKELGLVK